MVSLGKLTKKEVNPPLLIYFEILLHQSLKRRICHLNHIHTTTVLKQRIDNIHVKGFQMKTRTNATTVCHAVPQLFVINCLFSSGTTSKASACVQCQVHMLSVKCTRLLNVSNTESTRARAPVAGTQ